MARQRVRVAESLPALRARMGQPTVPGRGTVGAHSMSPQLLETAKGEAAVGATPWNNYNSDDDRVRKLKIFLVCQ